MKQELVFSSKVSWDTSGKLENKVYLNYGNLEGLKAGKDSANCSFTFTQRAGEAETLYKMAYQQWVAGYFELTPLPGCCGVVVSHNTQRKGYYLPENKPLSEEFRKVKEDFAKYLGFSLMIATTDMADIPAVKNMFKSGYSISKTFTNKRTSHLIGLGVKDL